MESEMPLQYKRNAKGHDGPGFLVIWQTDITGESVNPDSPILFDCVIGGNFFF